MNLFPILQTERLILREFRPADAQAIFAIFSQDIVTRYHNLETMRTIEKAERLVEARARLFERGLGIRWAITRGEQGDEVIGSCGYFNLHEVYRSVEIGYDLHPDYWRRGMMSEALQAVIAFGFSEAFWFGLNRIEALTYVEHEVSAALLRKLGFVEEGIRRESGYWKGQFHDLRAFSLLRRDWERITLRKEIRKR